MLQAQAQKQVQSEQQFPRFTFEEADQYMNQIFSTLVEESNERTNLIRKIYSLFLARQNEQSSRFVGLEKYSVNNVTENILGIFSTLELVPEEFRSKATEKNKYYSYYSGTNKSTITEWSVHVINYYNDVTKEVSDSYVNKTVDKMSYFYNKNVKIDWDAVLRDILSGALDLSTDLVKPVVEKDVSYLHFTQSQHKRGRFHPPPNTSDFLTEDRRKSLEALCIAFGIYFPSTQKSVSILDISQAVGELEKRLGLEGQTFVVDRVRNKKAVSNHDNFEYRCRDKVVVKKDTFKCVYSHTLLTEPSTFDVLRKYPFSCRSKKGYMGAVKLLSILRGRLHNVFNPSMQANGLVMDKTGLSFFMEPSTDPVTCVFLRYLHASFSTQKLFTINTQMHGGLDRWMKAALDLLIEENSPTTQFDHIFMLIPSDRTINLVRTERLEVIYTMCIEWLNQMSQLFTEQWALGVEECAKRFMMVPQSGTTSVNVNAWNACAGAWGNLLRFVRIIGRKLEYAPLQLFKVLKLTAGDQMKFAKRVGKGVDGDITIFMELTLRGIMPWGGLKASDRTLTEFNSIVSNACKEASIDPNKWLGGPVERSTKTKGDVLSVCGVVYSGDKMKAENFGLFGANPWTST